MSLILCKVIMWPYHSLFFLIIKIHDYPFTSIPSSILSHLQNRCFMAKFLQAPFFTLKTFLIKKAQILNSLAFACKQFRTLSIKAKKSIQKVFIIEGQQLFYTFQPMDFVNQSIKHLAGDITKNSSESKPHQKNSWGHAITQNINGVIGKVKQQFPNQEKESPIFKHIIFQHALKDHWEKQLRSTLEKQNLQKNKNKEIQQKLSRLENNKESQLAMITNKQRKLEKLKETIEELKNNTNEKIKTINTEVKNIRNQKKNGNINLMQKSFQKSMQQMRFKDKKQSQMLKLQRHRLQRNIKEQKQYHVKAKNQMQASIQFLQKENQMTSVRLAAFQKSKKELDDRLQTLRDQSKRLKGTNQYKEIKRENFTQFVQSLKDFHFKPSLQKVDGCLYFMVLGKRKAGKSSLLNQIFNLRLPIETQNLQKHNKQVTQFQTTKRKVKVFESLGLDEQSDLNDTQTINLINQMDRLFICFDQSIEEVKNLLDLALSMESKSLDDVILIRTKCDRYQKFEEENQFKADKIELNKYLALQKIIEVSNENDIQIYFHSSLRSLEFYNNKTVKKLLESIWYE